MADYDVITIGAGHTGLMASILCANMGKKVLCLEKNDFVGGLAGNAHYWPGYTHSYGAWYLMFSRLEWLEKEFELSKYGLELIYPDCPGVVMAGAGKGRTPFKMFADPKEQMENIAKDFGPETVQCFQNFYGFLAPFAQAMDYALGNEPMSVGQMMDAMPVQARDTMVKLFYGDVYSMINEFFPDREKQAAIRAQLMGLGTDGFYGGIRTPGSALTLAYHSTTPESGSGGSPYRFPKGHMGAFSETLARSFEAKGGELRLNTPVAKILQKNGTVYGVRLADGSEITCDKLISSLDPGNNFLKLMDADDLDPFFRKQVIEYKERCTDEHIAQAYVALNRVPEFSDEFKELNDGAWRNFVWDFDPDVAEDDWDAVKNGKLGQYCFATGLGVFSSLDPSLAPEGKHSATICAQYAWPIRTGKKIDMKQQMAESAEMMIRSYERYMPDFRKCVDDIHVGNPMEWEDLFGVTGGTWTHGMVKIENMFNCRPIVGMSDYRAPIKNMYLCGTSNHPGPGMSGFAPKNCVDAIKYDESNGKNRKK